MFITINGCRLFFDTYGSTLNVGASAVKEKPTLIVLHGGHGMVDHTLYVEFWSQFADLAQVIFLDQRGCGRSDHRSPEEWNLTYWAEDVYQFCQALGIEKPILAGVSMGGHVMCEYLARHPENLGGLIFCNTEARFILDDVCAQLERLGGTEIAEIARTQFTSPTAESARQYQEKCVPYYAKNAYSPQEIRRCIQNTPVLSHFYKNHIQAFNYLADLEKIKCPTLLMVGAESPLHLPARAIEMAARIPPELVTLHLFSGAGAPVYKDSPEEAESIVRTYLNVFFCNPSVAIHDLAPEIAETQPFKALTTKPPRWQTLCDELVASDRLPGHKRTTLCAIASLPEGEFNDLMKDKGALAKIKRVDIASLLLPLNESPTAQKIEVWLDSRSIVQLDRLKERLSDTSTLTL